MDNYEFFHNLFNTYNSQITTLFLIFLIIGIVVLTIYFVRKYNQRKESELRNYILSNSNILKKLYEINNEYDFQYDIQNCYFYPYKLCKTKTAYDNANIEKFAIEIIGENITFFEDKINIANNNKNLYTDYILKVYQLGLEITGKAYPEFSPKKQERCEEIERQFFNQKKLTPVTMINLCITKRYSSPQGRNYYNENISFSQDDIIKMIEKAKSITEHKLTAQYQRSLLTPSMRYNVMKRDSFRCVLCGASSDDGITQLEVDHIVPVSKGGVTEMSNLRTLCHNCNAGKSDKYTPFGVN